MQSAIHLACVLEATARKPGNTHRFRDLPGQSYLDFLLSAQVIAPILCQARSGNVGANILDAVRATKIAVGHNTNLGIILLLAPLAAAKTQDDLPNGLAVVLSSLNMNDAKFAYEAIRLANPGGLADSESESVDEEPTVNLLEAMRLAAHRDAIARQYATNFAEVFAGADRFSDARVPLEQAIIDLHLQFLADSPDTLIARKLGMPVARELQALARDGDRDRLDGWFEVDPAGRNPGSTADLVTACLFVAIRKGIIPVPFDRPWTASS